MKKSGFTLVELLATMVVLGIIMVIAIPKISGIINNTSKASFESDAKIVLRQIQFKKSNDDNFNPSDINKDNIDDVLDLSGVNYSSINATVEDNTIMINIVGIGQWEGLIACGTYYNMKVVQNLSDCGNDGEAPVITITGENPVTVSINATYTDAGATATDNVDGDITGNIVTTGTVNTSLVGTYTITYTVSDASGNESVVSRAVNVVDNIGPTVTFDPYSNGTLAPGRTVTVIVSDVHSSVDSNSLKYQWKTSTTTPTEVSFTDAFTNGANIISPFGASGTYYLWILAKDTFGNTTIIRSGGFKLGEEPIQQ